MTARTPRPGEIWRYTCPVIGDRVGVVDAVGRATVIDGDNRIPADPEPAELVGYTVRYVDQLRHRDEATAEPKPWETLRAADQIHSDSANYVDTGLVETYSLLADRLEREAAEKLKRDRMIEKAARVHCDGFYGEGYFDQLAPDDEVRCRYLNDASLLADAGLLAEAVTK